VFSPELTPRTYNPSALNRPESTPLRLDLPHVLDQALHALDRRGFVDRGAHATDGAVAFQLHHAARFGAFQAVPV